ncbi:hypothetical protein HDU98_002552 [Podochytrium sp. JEL0797]|nr:hypothetical protein HDU98_002552 [Podochytrium sp. JEL0797]
MQLTATPSQGSFASGDTFRATLCFSNPTDTTSDGISLAWGFAQLIGTFHFDPNSVRFDSDALASFKSKSVGVGGGFGEIALKEYVENDTVFPLFSTSASMLFFDMNLANGDSRTISYEIQLPINLPPSHTGKAVKISYKLIIGVQPAGSGPDRAQKPQLFQMPIRLFAAVGDILSRRVFDMSVPIVANEESAVVEEITGSDFGMLRPSDLASLCPLFSPTAVATENEDEEMTLTQHLIMQCQMSGKLTFNIRKGEDMVSHFTLVRQAFRLGETILGVLDFSKGTIPCFQVSAFLEQTETVTEPHSTAFRPRAIRRVLAQQHACTINTSRMDISLPIPAKTTPDFSTSVVTLSYHIRLEFITARGGGPAASVKLMQPVTPIVQPNTTDDIVLNEEEVENEQGVQHFSATQTTRSVAVEAFEHGIDVKVFPSGSMGAGVGKMFLVQ